ncbi:MAG TPA: hypothetical protein VFT74_17710, partial [Isosphaeraceae bacterium]|nr:hypothetical protein [Isosphaeraceae bacterium]
MVRPDVSGNQRTASAKPRTAPKTGGARRGSSGKKVAVFWPGDYRAKHNEWALPQAREATEQLMVALKKLGRSPYLVEGFLRKPGEAIAKLGPIDDPMVGLFVHWT